MHQTVLQIEKMWSTHLYSARYVQSTDFHQLECRFDQSINLNTASQDERFFLQRFIDATDVKSTIHKILKHPFSHKIGLTHSIDATDSHKTVTYVLPKAHYIHRHIGSLQTSYQLVEHQGAHIEPIEYISYIARGEFPLSAEPSWHMIHDRLDHVIGTLSVAAEEFAQQKSFAEKTLSLSAQSEDFKKRCLVLTDVLDAFTYDTTLNFVKKQLPTEKTYRQLVDEFNKKHVQYELAFDELDINAKSLIERLTVSFDRAFALL